MFRVLLLVGLVALGAPTGASPGELADPWRSLYRPLEIPRIAPGQRCPTSEVDNSVDFTSFGVGTGLGPGPAYPVGFNVANRTLTLASAANFRSTHWMGQKVLWFVHPRYTGPVLVRGRQLDGKHRVRFDRGGTPPRELRIAPLEAAGIDQSGAGRARPSYTRLRAPGCYAYQVDGTSFSRIVVFRALSPRS